MAVASVFDFRFSPEATREGVGIAQAIGADMPATSGCIGYDVIRDLADPGHVLVVTSWNARSEGEAVLRSYIHDPKVDRATELLPDDTEAALTAYDTLPTGSWARSRAGPELAQSSRDDAPYRNRQLAESFGADAARYDRVRPSYPQALANAVLADLPGSRVLDVGIGTGLSSLPFRKAGAEVLGVDADVRMAEFARTRGFEVDVARFEEWDATGNRFDAVIAGQAWHWIDPVVGAAQAAAVLRPRGRLATFWNIADPEPDMAAAFADVYRSVDTGLPSIPWTTPALDGYGRLFTSTTDGIRAAQAFTTPVEERFTWHDTITRDVWLEQVPITRGHDRIPPDRLAALLEGLSRAIDRHGGTFTMDYVTVAITVSLAGAKE